MLADHLYWTATTVSAHNQAFNIVNGDVFRWKWMWQQIADYFCIPVGEYPEEVVSLEERMKGKEGVWDEIVKKHSLQKTELNKLASWWHTDSDLSRTFETFADMSKSRKLGYNGFKKSSESFTDLFDQLRAEKIIPGV
ncbi:hypothetical protein BH11CYA1_BH11CYA1_08580 [soil metagenome]